MADLFAQILEGSADDALRWLDSVETGQITLPDGFDWPFFHQMCRDYVSGYYLETFHRRRPDLQPVADKIERIMRTKGIWEE
jgi:hypothetical protein